MCHYGYLFDRLSVEKINYINEVGRNSAIIYENSFEINYKKFNLKMSL